MKQILSGILIWLAFVAPSFTAEVVSEEVVSNKVASHISSVEVLSTADVPLGEKAPSTAERVPPVIEKTAPVEVGKHVAANMDAMSMILSLLMVLVVIIISAVILKRFQGVRHSINGLKIVTSLHLGAKEKLVVVQAGEKQLLLGVTAQQISLLETLDEPLISAKENSVDFAQSIAKLLKQKAIKTYDKQK
jgi:flagellar protein FliO/FliZ